MQFRDKLCAKIKHSLHYCIWRNSEETRYVEALWKQICRYRVPCRVLNTVEYYFKLNLTPPQMFRTAYISISLAGFKWYKRFLEGGIEKTLVDGTAKIIWQSRNGTREERHQRGRRIANRLFVKSVVRQTLLERLNMLRVCAKWPASYTTCGLFVTAFILAASILKRNDVDFVNVVTSLRRDAR